jgi:molecular chaperone GrpE
MSDEPLTDDDGPSLAMPEPVAAPEAAAEVTFVVPAPPYEALATAGLAGEPPAGATPTPPRAFAPGFDPSTILDAVASTGASLDRKLDALRALFDREVRAEATREKVVDRLHAELQEYKQDLLLNVLRPIFVDLIQLHDDIGKMVEAQAGAEGEAARLLSIMQGYQQGIEDILYRQGVEPFVEEGESFDPRRQRAVATVPVDDPARAKTIAARHRKGFQTQANGRVIRPEIVSVYSFKK